jgi:hypothetical protein
LSRFSGSAAGEATAVRQFCAVTAASPVSSALSDR